MKKYICVEDYIDRNGAYPASTPTTLKQVCDELKEMPVADVITIDWIRQWFKDHYHTDAPAMLADWRSEHG